MLVKESGLMPHEMAANIQMQAGSVEAIKKTMDLADNLAHEHGDRLVKGCKACLKRQKLIQSAIMEAGKM